MMNGTAWYVRWQIVRALVWAAFRIAPRSAARTIYIDALNEASRQMMREIGPTPSQPSQERIGE